MESIYSVKNFGWQASSLSSRFFHVPSLHPSTTLFFPLSSILLCMSAHLLNYPQLLSPPPPTSLIGTVLPVSNLHCSLSLSASPYLCLYAFLSACQSIPSSLPFSTPSSLTVLLLSSVIDSYCLCVCPHVCLSVPVCQSAPHTWRRLT